jgi:hypothetical protein
MSAIVSRQLFLKLEDFDTNGFGAVSVHLNAFSPIPWQAVSLGRTYREQSNQPEVKNIILYEFE